MDLEETKVRGPREIISETFGETEKGMFNGFSSMKVFDKGEFQQGYVKDNKREGPFIIKDENGLIYKAKFKNDEYVPDSAEPINDFNLFMLDKASTLIMSRRVIRRIVRAILSRKILNV